MNFKKRVSFNKELRFKLDLEYQVPDDLKLNNENNGIPRTYSYNAYSPNRKKPKQRTRLESANFRAEIGY